MTASEPIQVEVKRHDPAAHRERSPVGKGIDLPPVGEAASASWTRVLYKVYSTSGQKA